MYFSLDRNIRNIAKEPVPASTQAGPFRALLGEGAWQRLAVAVRQRFAELPVAGVPQRYAGRYRVIRRSLAGWCFAQACRLIGSPLPVPGGRNVPALVMVSREPAGDGVVWRRLYRFREGERVCSTVKRHDATAGLLECVGRRFGMVLRLSEEGGELHFRSTRFFCRLGRRRLAWPLWLSPGQMHVTHADAGEGRFRFVLSVRHPWFGETFYQDGLFQALEG